MSPEARRRRGISVVSRTGIATDAKKVEAKPNLALTTGYLYSRKSLVLLDCQQSSVVTMAPIVRDTLFVGPVKRIDAIFFFKNF